MQVNGRLTSQRRRRGASAVEYIMIVALIVLPLAIMADATIFFPWTGNPSALRLNDGSAGGSGRPTLIYSYFERISTMMRMPLG